MTLLHSINKINLKPGYPFEVRQHLERARLLAVEALAPLVGKVDVEEDIQRAIGWVSEHMPRVTIESATLSAGNYAVRINYSNPITLDSIKTSIIGM
jgi:hypothetical protein